MEEESRKGAVSNVKGETIHQFVAQNTPFVFKNARLT